MVKQVVTLLVLVALGANALPGPECERLNKALPMKDLHKISGDWVMVWSVADTRGNDAFLVNLSSSHLEVRFNHDNSIVMLNERNLRHDSSCVVYATNLSLTIDSDELVLKTFSGTVEEAGVVSQYNETIKIVFFESCDDCLLMEYSATDGHFLLSYKREGSHRDVEQLKAAHGDHQKQAECMGLLHDKPFVYDGVTDFCHKKSSPETTSEQS